MNKDEIKRSVARQIANAYCRKCWWASRDELEQEAWVAMLLADRSYDPEKGDYRGYIYKAARTWIGGFLLTESAPVTCGTTARKGELVGLRRTNIDTARSAAANGESDLPHQRMQQLAAHAENVAGIAAGEFVFTLTQPETTIATLELRRKTIARLVELLTAEPQNDLAVPILLGEETSAEVAARTGIAIEQIYVVAKRARRRVAADPVLSQLYIEGIEGTA